MNPRMRTILVACLALAIRGNSAGWAIPPAVNPQQAEAPAAEQVLPLELDVLDTGQSRASFSMEKLPEKIRKLNGRRVRIRGYMYPTFTEHGNKAFHFIGETRQGKPMRWTTPYEEIPLHYLIFTEMAPKSSASWTWKPFILEARLKIKPERGDGGLYEIYQFENAKIISPTKPRRGFSPALGYGC